MCMESIDSIESHLADLLIINQPFSASDPLSSLLVVTLTSLDSSNNQVRQTTHRNLAVYKLLAGYSLRGKSSDCVIFLKSIL